MNTRINRDWATQIPKEKMHGSLIVLTILLIVSSVNFVYAQSSESNSNPSYDAKFQKLDDIMNAQIAATLTGLSLTGGSFLTHLTKGIQDSNVIRIHLARRSFIKAFFMFLMCTIAVFLFDFLQILNETNILFESFVDILVTYSLFGMGSYYLMRAAKALYVTYGVRSDL